LRTQAIGSGKLKDGEHARKKAWLRIAPDRVVRTPLADVL